MAIPGTPHTESQQNRKESETDLTPNQIAERLERDGDAGIYANTDGAQTGMNRSAHMTDGNRVKHKVEPEVSAETGATSSQVGDSNAQGITNHSQHAEHDGQVRVMEGREQAVAASSGDSEEHQNTPTRNSIKSAEDKLPGAGAEKSETIEISAFRAVR